MITFSVSAEAISGLPDGVERGTLLLPSVYHGRSLYLDALPHFLFDPDETPFLPTSASFCVEGESPAAELERLMLANVYILLSGLQAPKKAKKPADGVSYGELALFPLVACVELPIRELLARAEGGEPGFEVSVDSAARSRTVTARSVVFPVYGVSGPPPAGSDAPGCTLTATLGVTFPDPEACGFAALTVDVGSLDFLGSFSNLKTLGPSSLPPCGWGLSMQLPCLPDRSFEGARNGRLALR